MSDSTITMVLFFLGFSFTLKAQVLDSENKLSINLSDGTQVVLYGKSVDRDAELSKEYYYLPTNPKLAKTAKGHPAFLFQRFTTENADEDYSGAIMHFLMNWGLTEKQRTEVENILRNGRQGAKKGSELKGAVEVTPGGDQSFNIISGTLLKDSDGAPKVIKSGHAPIQPGARIAAAAKLNAKDAQLMAATFEGNTAISDMTIELSYKYTVLTPAVKGRITVNWNKFFEEIRKDSAAYTATYKKKSRGGLFGFVADALFGKPEKVDTQDYDEVRSAVDSLVNMKVIDVQFDEYITDERANGIRESFLEFFMDQITETVQVPNPPAPGNKEKEAMPNIRVGKKYTFNREYLERSIRRDSQVYNLNYRLSIEKYHTTASNLSEWYNAHKSNKYCVPETVVLNDPDFEHRNVQVILDGDTKDMFEDRELNFVNIKVRKIRKDANDFNTEIVFTAESQKEDGDNRNVLTYSKAQSDDAEVFEYQRKWSFKGGKEYLEDSTWMKGDWEGITISPPLKPVVITYSAADPTDLKDNGVYASKLQIKYSKLGKIEETEISLNFNDTEPQTKTIYIDAEAKGLVYRHIYVLKRGYLVTDWENNITNEIFVFLPEELEPKEKTPSVLEKIDAALQKGKEMLQKTEKEENVDILKRYEEWIIKN